MLPDWVIAVLADRSFHTFATKVIIATELFIAFGLWWRRSRYAAVWIAICFHLAIEVSARVEVFSYLAVAALVIWAVPSTRDRVLVVDYSVGRHRTLVTATRWLDWLARFRIVAGPRARRSASSTVTAAFETVPRRFASSSAGCHSPHGSPCPRCCCGHPSKPPWTRPVRLAQVTRVG